MKATDLAACAWCSALTKRSNLRCGRCGRALGTIKRRPRYFVTPNPGPSDWPRGMRRRVVSVTDPHPALVLQWERPDEQIFTELPSTASVSGRREADG